MSSYRTESVALDGGSMDLHVWTPDAGSGPGIVLIQEIFGVGPYIRAVASRLADAGYVVGAPDVFWRFARGWAPDHDEKGLNDSIALMSKFDFPAAVGDCIAALGTLAALPGTTGTPAVMGYCLGGTLSLAVAIHGEPAACVSYYGSGAPDMAGMLDQVHCPVLFHFGSEDGYIPNDKVEALNAAIAGRPDITLNVEIAGHAFDNHEAAMFYNEGAAKSAWSKTMAFLGRHLAV
jgi:carboxymethylenebutenolidase